MKVYRFSLGTVMRIRALEERIARERVVVAQRDLRHAQVLCAAVEASLAALEAPIGLTTISEVHWIADQAARLSEEVRANREVVAAAASVREEASRSWHLARKRLATLERLDSEGRARWKNEVQRHEVAELDDLSNARHGLAGVRS